VVSDSLRSLLQSGYSTVICLAHRPLTLAAKVNLNCIGFHLHDPVESKQEYRRERIQRGRLALLISLISLLFAAWSLFETALRQPSFSVYVGPFWQYGRGPDSDDEVLTVPITFANNGARPGAIVNLTLTVEQSGSRTREFVASGYMANERDQALFAPILVPGRTAYSASIIFTPNEDTQSIQSVIRAAGSYSARLTICTTYDATFGLFDTLLTVPPPDIIATVTLQHFDLSELLHKRVEAVSVKTSDDPHSGKRACPGNEDHRTGILATLIHSGGNE
jgi:hypothetical protein